MLVHTMQIPISPQNSLAEIRHHKHHRQPVSFLCVSLPAQLKLQHHMHHPEDEVRRPGANCWLVSLSRRAQQKCVCIPLTGKETHIPYYYLHLVYTVYFHIHFDWKYASTQTMHRQSDRVQLWHWQMPQWSLSCRQSPIRTDLKDTINEKIRVTTH